MSFSATRIGDDPPPPALVSWSTGKDSAYALSEVRRSKTVTPVGLLTTVTEQFGRVSMHGVREELLQRQAASVGLPLIPVRIPYPCPNETYEREMGRVLAEARAQGVRHVVYGDLFLDDIRTYRVSRMATVGMICVFPLWHRPTPELARAMIRDGVRARIACVDPRKIDRRFAGRAFDEELLQELPTSVDPCGENGEFHTFVTDAPAFRTPVSVSLGEVVERDGFVFADLLPS